MPGTGSKLVSAVAKTQDTNKHKHRYTDSATLLLSSKQRLAGRAALQKLLLSRDGFYVNGSLNRRCVMALVAYWEPSDPLLLSFN